ALLLAAAPPASAAPFRFQITSTPAGTLVVGPPGGDAVADVEIDDALVGDDDGEGFADEDAASPQPRINRTVADGPTAGPTAKPRAKAKSNPELVLTQVGLNFHDQRFANGGNQFSVEPPDQGLCAGNGFVVESANDVLRIYGASGTALTAVVDLNTFYGYPPAINRGVTPLQFGPSVTDPSCYFDADTQRWFHLVLTLDRASPTTQTLSGANHLDLPVSTTSDPTGSWVVYRIPVQNDGTQGTPDHNCRARVSGQLVHGPCLGDYPHIAPDANGIFLTTNEFNLFASGFRGAQVYELSKSALAANA